MSTAPDLHRIRPTWADIDVGAFRRNVETVASRLPSGSRLIPVLKADAYGHGAAELAKHCPPDRVAMIATSLLEESLELRRAGITLPLLVLGPINEPQIREAIDNKIVIGVPGPEELEIVARIARERDVDIHLKLDSGMGRMGSTETDLPRVIELVRSASRLRIGAIYTHFANAGDPHDPFTEEQSARFDRMVQALREGGVGAPRTAARRCAASSSRESSSVSASRSSAPRRSTSP
jgi:alanine racemase